LRTDRTIDLAELHAALELDSLIQSLLQRAMGEQAKLENRMLQIHYRINHIYRTSRVLSATAARQALDEMSMVVMDFANIAGENKAAA